ncbi:MAG TPA: hypothetical protein VLG48_04060, partial [Candidatus Methylomirabilis sp.]|nr:hypothetical protein [Candidatus Methylomirabilis sp.]
RFRGETQGGGGWDTELNALAGAHTVVGFLRATSDQDVPVRDESLNASPGEAADSSEINIQSLARLRPHNNELSELHSSGP